MLVAPKVGVCPGTGLFAESFNVIVTVDVADPLAMTGPEPVMVEFAGSAVGAVKTTMPSDFVIGVAIERVFDSAVKELKLQVEIPRAEVDVQTP